MAQVHEIQGYVIVLDKVVHITRIFEAPADRGAQFNVGMVGDSRLQLTFPDRATASLERDLLVKAVKQA